MVQVVVDDAGDEVITVVMSGVATQRQRLTQRGAGSLGRHVSHGGMTNSKSRHVGLDS